GKEGENKRAVQGRGAAQRILERAEGRATLGYLTQQVKQVPRRARQPIEPADNHRVALLEPAHQLAELGPIGLSARDLLAIDFDTTGRLEVGDLAGEVLVAGGNPRISDDHFSISFRKQHMEFSRPTKSGRGQMRSPQPPRTG